MRVDFMRKVDKYIGVPICYFFSILDLISRLFLRKINKTKVDKVLFIQISEMGSAVSIIPAILELKKKHPRVEIHYLIFEEITEIVELINLVKKENIFKIKSRSFLALVLDAVYVIWRLRMKKIDIVIDMELFSRFSSILSYLSGAKDIIGFNRFYMEGLYRGSFQAKRVIYNHTKHIALNFLSCVRAVDQPNDDRPLVKIKEDLSSINLPLLPCSREDEQNIVQKIKSINPQFSLEDKVVILNPNASLLLPLRKWPLDRYIELAKKIIEESSAFIVLTGTKKEQGELEAIVSAVADKRCINLAGKTTLKELISLYNVAHVLVSNDSGPPNFATLTNIKIIVLFGPETPLCYAPLGRNVKVMYADLMCSPCVSAYNHRKSACNDNKCMKAIKVEDVYNGTRANL